MNEVLLLCTIGPPLLILLFIIRSDKFKEPSGLIIKTFLLGWILCIPAGFLNGIFIWSQDNPYEYAYIAGLTEESIKFLAIYFYIRLKTDFNEPMDAIVYGTLISLGFATIENLQYVFLSDPEFSSSSIALIRAFTAIPMHASCGIIMGYYFGIYAFSAEKSALLKSLLIPMVFHGLYNLFIGSSILGLVLLVGIIYFALKLHKKVSMLQKSKNTENEPKMI
tara:strand:- start:1687 stop:2352 length:666 start_codon:yes stop_codon:yes gene_type:complete